MGDDTLLAADPNFEQFSRNELNEAVKLALEKQIEDGINVTYDDYNTECRKITKCPESASFLDHLKDLMKILESKV
jgi:hypothetical protein